MTDLSAAGRADTEDGRIAWARVGNGPPLLLINGYAATGADWDPSFLELLAADFTVICPDNRGTGASDLGAGELTISRLATDMVAVLDSLSIEQAAVVGWSMGGFVAQQLAAGEPARVGGLVLLATDPGGPGAEQCDPRVSAQLYDDRGTPREQAGRLIDLLFPPVLAAAIVAEFGDLVAEARANLSSSTLRAEEEAMRRWHAERSDLRLAALRAPTLVLAGAQDAIIPAVNSRAPRGGDPRRSPRVLRGRRARLHRPGASALRRGDPGLPPLALSARVREKTEPSSSPCSRGPGWLRSSGRWRRRRFPWRSRRSRSETPPVPRSVRLAGCGRRPCSGTADRC